MHRIFAVALRYWYMLYRSYDRLADIFFYPIVDLAMWGLGSQYIRNQIQDYTYIAMVLSGLLMWIIVWRAQHEIIVSVLHEYWDGNLVNLFVSPLSVTEWLASVMFFSLFKILLSFAFACAFTQYVYGVNLIGIGPSFFFMVLILVLTGWALGTLISAGLFIVGTKAQGLPFSIAAFLSPFAAIVYPVSALPNWAQSLAFYIPSTHVFEVMRFTILGIQSQSYSLAVGFFLASIYFIISIWILKLAFKAALSRGLRSA